MTNQDISDINKPGLKVIYLAGGCFWGMEKLMQSILGVVRTMPGYANGTVAENPTYPAVCTGVTGFKETVRVEYDPERISLDALLFDFFRAIDPSVRNRQGHDVGSQYQTGIYYTDEASKQAVARIAGIEAERAKNFAVEIKPLENFYDAEEYHQKYLDKNPGGYCHIPTEEIDRLSKMIIDPGKYPRPAKESITKQLTDTQYHITREAGTETPFKNEFWDHFARGIYVDIVTGEPLFSSRDKYRCSCGWPGFSAPIDENVLVYIEDRSHGMNRTEVRSRAGNSHLGHVFYHDPESPTATRYCINSGALRFIPVTEIEKEGYGYLTPYVD